MGEASDRTFEDTDIAIIGMSCRLPGADSIDMYWENLRDGVDSIQFFSSDELEKQNVFPTHARYVKAASLLRGIEMFDASLFGYSPREAAIIDPQQRVFLECSWEALEDAGYNSHLFDGTIGVYAGASMNTYLINNVHPACGYSPARTFLESGIDLQVLFGNGSSFLPSRVSYKLNLKGPSVNVQTACSTGLAVVHQACQSLLAGECDMALAGAVSIRVPQKKGYAYQDGLMHSPDGKCRAFDSRAQGTVFRDGVGVVVLKLLGPAISHGDAIRAVIKGSAINNDGSTKMDYAAPAVAGQAAVIQQALAAANVDASTVTYVEAHGTGTRLGDPVEIAALARAFRQSTIGALRNDKGYCAIGSVKTNIGHLSEAAGIAGLIKTVLALQHKQVPPSLHFSQPNPNILFDDTPFYVNTKLSDWKPRGGVRRAGVSAFGIGGTNAHVTLEEPPAATAEASGVDRPCHLVTLSAHSETSLIELTQRFQNYLSCHTDVSLPDVGFTLNTGRQHLRHRLAIVARSAGQLQSKLASISAKPSAEENPRAGGLAFLFNGAGTQYPGMGQELYKTESLFRDTLNYCSNLLSDQGLMKRPLLEALYPSRPASDCTLDDIAYAQPAIFVVQIALARLLESWGIRPDVVLGYGAGEYAAACVAGALSLEDGLRLVAESSRLVQTTIPGKMAEIWAAEAQVADAISRLLEQKNYSGAISIAAINGPKHVVISGTPQAVRAICAAFEQQQIRTARLHVLRALHSPLLDPILSRIEHAARCVSGSEPQLTLISSVTGKVIEKGGLAEPSYWSRHVRGPVQFGAGMCTLKTLGVDVLAEIGPSPVLLEFGRNCLPAHRGLWLPTLSRRSRADAHCDHDDWMQLLTTLANLHVNGAEIDWFAFDRDYKRRRVHLPTYPFQRERHWMDAPGRRIDSDRTKTHPLLGEDYDIRFEPVLSVQVQKWLDEQSPDRSSISGSAVCMEMALAAGATVLNTESLEISHLQLSEPLTSRMQLILSQISGGRYRFQLSSVERQSDSEAAKNAVIHATGLLCKNHREGAADLAALRAECPDEAPACGSTLIERLWRGAQSSIAQIKLPVELASELDSYHCHPSLLDACLGMLGERNGNSVILGLQSVFVYGRADTYMWSYCREEGFSSDEPEPRETVTADFRLFGRDGRPVADLHGVRFRRRPNPLPQGLRWWPQARFGLSSGEMPGVTEILKAVEPKHQVVMSDRRLETYRDAMRRLDSIASGYIVQSLISMGLHFHVDQTFTTNHLARELKVANVRWLDRLLSILEGAGTLRKESASDRVREARWRVIAEPAIVDTDVALGDLSMPEIQTEASLLRRCGAKLAEGLQGNCNPVHVLFPEGVPSDIAAFYRESPVLQAMNVLVRDVIQYIFTRLQPGGGIRILEVGAGTGATTSAILPYVEADRVQYTFTDISASLLAQARERLRAYPFVSYERFDIDRPPDVQGFGDSQYDLIVAANVLHCSRDLKRSVEYMRRMLAPEGTLVMVEGTAPVSWIDVTFGFADGWWHFADHDLRPSYPLIDIQSWRKLLTASGFSEIVDLEAPNCSDGNLHSALIVAQASSRSAPRAWLILADDTGMAGRLNELLGGAGDACVLVSLEPNESGFDYKLNAAIGAYSLHGIVLCSTGSSQDAAVQARRLTLVQSLIGGRHSARVLWLVTRGCFKVSGTDGESPTDIAFDRDLVVSRIDLDPNATVGEAQALVAELVSQPAAVASGRVVAFRGDRRYVASTLDVSPDPIDRLESIPRKDAPAREADIVRQIEHAPPEDRYERLSAYVAERIADVLGMPVRELMERQSGADCQFSDIGGDSLAAIELRSHFQRDLECELPSTLVYEYPTIDALAGYLWHARFAGFDTLRLTTRHRASSSALVPIQPRGSRMPLFCVPGVLGDVSAFDQLGRSVGKDQPLYALRAAGLDSGTKPHSTVHEIADYHVQAVTAVQPDGPYTLLGHSFGGLVAFEMAQQLLEKGASISLVAILDVQAGVGKKYKDSPALRSTRSLAMLAQIFGRMFKSDSQWFSEVDASLRPEQQLNKLVQLLEAEGLLFSRTEITALERVFVANIRAMSDYRPRSRRPVAITLFRASEAHPEDSFLPNRAATLRDPAWGWQPLSSEPVEIRIVSGNHFTMMVKPHILSLARELASCLERASAVGARTKSIHTAVSQH